MDSFVPTLATVSLVVSIVNFVKFLKVRDWNGVVTQVAVWVAGVAVIFLVAQTDWAETIGSGLFGQSLAGLDGWSLLFVGLSVGSVATVTNEFKKAFDHSDSAAKPPMVEDSGSG